MNYNTVRKRGNVGQKVNKARSLLFPEQIRKKTFSLTTIKSRNGSFDWFVHVAVPEQEQKFFFFF